MKPRINALKINPVSWLRRRAFNAGSTGRFVRPTEFLSAILSARISPLWAVAVACAAILAPSTSRASLMAYEGFNYATGSANLTGQGGGFGWSGLWNTINNGASSMTSGSLVAGANAPTGYDSLSAGNAAGNSLISMTCAGGNATFHSLTVNKLKSIWTGLSR